MPVVVAPNDTLIEKLKSNLQEVRARGGELFVFADADSHINSGEGLHVIRLPEHYGVLSPILHVVPLQLLAYHTATARGTDVDKPRNLAKCVTMDAENFLYAIAICIGRVHALALDPRTQSMTHQSRKNKLSQYAINYV